MDGKSPEVTSGVETQAASQIETPAAAPSSTPKESASADNVSGLRKLLARLGIRKGNRPLIEMKPPVATGSEGRARIDREQLRQKLEEPPQS